MPRRSLKQDSFFDPELVCPTCIEKGTMAWLLARHRSKLFPRWLFKGWRGESRLGRNAWPPVVLMSLLLLRFSEEGMSRRASCRRARTDLQWRAAMGLDCGIQPPDEKTVRDFEKFLRARHPEVNHSRFMLFHEHIVRLCLRADVLDEETTWMMDSTPMWCYGAVLDTVRLIGEGIKKVVRQWAQGRRVSVDIAIAEWELDWFDAPSIKGAFNIDWTDKEARSELITRLAQKAVEIVEEVRASLHEVRRGKRKKLLRLSRNLMKVIEQNLEATPEGGLQVAQQVASDRLISITDPEARHGRKSHSKTFNGFKIHVLGDAISGLIASVTVTAGNVHDGQPAPRLVRRAKALCESMHILYGDTAYGATKFRVITRKLHDVTIIAPPPKPTSSKDGLGKSAFQIDLKQGRAICPNGVLSEDMKYVSYGSGGAKKGPRFLWPKEICEDCPLAEQCKAKRKKHGNSRMLFHSYEEQMRAIRAQWEKPSTRQQYRKRAQGERLINETVRRGARKAMAWGVGSAQLQAHVIAMVNNLALLASALAEREEPAAAFDAAG